MVVITSIYIWLATGCSNGNGRSFKSSSIAMSSVDLGVQTSNLNGTGNTDWMCPSDENVFYPDATYRDYYLDGSMEFKVCTHRAQSTRIQVKGYVHFSPEKICAIPVYYANGVPSPYWDPAASADAQAPIPYYQCANIQSEIAEFNFLETSSTPLNGVVLTEEVHLPYMINCLATNNESYCPVFAIGKIR